MPGRNRQKDVMFPRSEYVNKVPLKLSLFYCWRLFLSVNCCFLWNLFINLELFCRPDMWHLHLPHGCAQGCTLRGRCLGTILQCHGTRLLAEWGWSECYWQTDWLLNRLSSSHCTSKGQDWEQHVSCMVIPIVAFQFSNYIIGYNFITTHLKALSYGKYCHVVL